MKGVRVRPCEDGSQKAAHLLKAGCCRRAQGRGYCAGQNPVQTALFRLSPVCGPAEAARFVAGTIQTLGMNRASGLARIYFLL